MVSDTDFFLAYMLAALHCSLHNEQAAGSVLDDAEREQAWHLLSYALRMEKAWQPARDLLLALAPKMEQAGFRGDWLAYLQQGESCATQLGDRRGAAELQLHIGHLHRLTSQFAAARCVLEQSLAHFTELGDGRGRVRALNHLGYVEWQAHHYEEANRLAEATLLLCEGEDAETRQERAMSLSVLGLVAKEQLRWPDAEKYQRRALTIRSELGLVREAAFSLQNLGAALCEQREFVEGISSYEQALTILTESNDTYHCAIIQMNLGQVHHNQGNYEKAILLSQQAEACFRRHQAQHYLTGISTNLAVAYLAMKDWHQAECYFLQSIHAYTELGNEIWRLLTMDGLAESYLGQQRYGEAQDLLLTIQSELAPMVNEPYYGYLCQAVVQHLQAAQAGVQSTQKELRG